MGTNAWVTREVESPCFHFCQARAGRLAKREKRNKQKSLEVLHGDILFSVFAGEVRLACSSGSLLASSAAGLKDRVHPGRPSLPVGVEKPRLG